ncbi:MAG: ABC transporter permease [Clostridia bacterium]
MDTIFDARIKRNAYRTLLKSRLQRLTRNKLSLLGVTIFLLILLSSLFAPVLTTYQPTDMNLSELNLPPSANHILGTDRLGRDMLAQILYGGRISIYVGVVGSVITTFLGVVLGSLSAFVGGMLDRILVKLSELFHSFPHLLLVMLLAGIMGQNINNLIIIFIFTGWMTAFRLMRSQVLSAKEETYVTACKAIGLSQSKIIFSQILPNILSPMLVSMSVNTANFILSETSLSFLGLGVPITTPTWGNIINVARDIRIISEQWWIWLFPCIVISLFVLSINFLGDGLRDVFDAKN